MLWNFFLQVSGETHQGGGASPLRRESVLTANIVLNSPLLIQSLKKIPPKASGDKDTNITTVIFRAH